MTTPMQPVFDELKVRPPEVTVDAPVEIPQKPSLLRRLDRWRPLTLALALAFPLITIRTGNVMAPGELRQILEWPLFRFGRFSSPIVGLAHRRPLEVCPSIDEEFGTHVQALSQARRVRGVARLAVMVRDQHRASRAILMGPCTGGWLWKPGHLSHLYAQFARDAPVAWVFGRWGGSEVTIALFVLISALLGSYALARLVLHVANSNLLLGLSLVAFGWTVSELFRIFGRELLWALYGVLTCWLIVSFDADTPRRSRLAMALLVGALIVHLAGYLLVAYSVALGMIAVSIALMSLSIVARPSRIRVVQLAAVVAGVWLLFWDCSAFSKRQLAPTSALNFVSGGSFGEMALSTGFWTERPNPVSQPLGDSGVFAAYFAEPFIREHAVWMYEYQGFRTFGKALLRATVFRYPGIAVAGVFKRLLVLVVKLDVLAEPLFLKSPWFVRMSQVAAGAVLVLAAFVVWIPSRWHLEAPVILMPLWNVFGVELLTHLIHTHSWYYMFGLMQVAVLAPVLVLIAAREARRRWPMRPLFGRPTWRAPVIAACGVLLIVFGFFGYAGARRELRTFDIWYHPWVGMYRAPLDRQSLEPGVVQDRIEGLRAFGESAPGSISMYGAWMMWRLNVYPWAADGGVGPKLGMTAAEVAARRKDANDRGIQYFRRASAEAPDNPWIQTFTYQWDPDRVPDVYPRLLERFPDHPYAPWWAYMMTAHARGDSQIRYADILDDLTHKQLVASEGLRPGFVEKPAIEGVGIVRARAESTEVQLNGQDAAHVGSADAYGSDRLGLMIDLRVISGSLLANLEVRTDHGVVESPDQRLSPADVHKYRVFHWMGSPARRMTLRLRASGDVPAIVLVRDFYPLIENPHVASID